MRVLLVDDHALFRDGLHTLLNSIDTFSEILEQASGSQAIQFIEEDANIDLVLLDYQLDDMDGLNVLKIIKNKSPEIPIIMLSAHENTELIQNALHDGASGFITKASTPKLMVSAINIVVSGGIYIPPEILTKPIISETKNNSTHISAHPFLAIEEVASEYQLTQRQREVLKEMGKGFSNKEIARELNMSPSTVKVHVAAILKELKAKNRTIAVSLAKDSGLITGQEHN